MCPYCSSSCISHGTSSTGNKRYRCKICKRTHSKRYNYKACCHNTSDKVRNLTKEGCGIRSISRLLRIGVNTVLRKLRYIANQTMKPILSFGKEYELDEMCTYVKSKTRKRWIVYAIRKDTREVVDFSIGSRTNKTLKRLTDTLILSNALKVFTDKLPNYKSLLPSSIHSTKYRGTNHIERKNLTLRTHLKRLSRRTICFSKSDRMLVACLRIYFWG